MSYVLSLRRHFPNHDISKCCGYWPWTSSHKRSSWDHPSFSTPWCLFRCGQTNCTTLRQRGSMWTMVCLPQFPWLPLCTPWWILTKNTMFFYWSPPLRLNLWCYQHMMSTTRHCCIHLFYMLDIHSMFPPPTPLTVGGGNVVGYGGVHFCCCDIPHLLWRGTNYDGMPRVIRGITHVIQCVGVVEIVRCLMNAHNGCHVVLCRTFFNWGEFGSGSVMKSPSQFMIVEVVVASAYDRNGLILHIQYYCPLFFWVNVWYVLFLHYFLHYFLFTFNNNYFLVFIWYLVCICRCCGRLLYPCLL